MGSSKLFGFNEPVNQEHGTFNDGEHDAMNEWVCKEIGNKLAQTYPGYPWGVMSEVEHGIVKICLNGFNQWPIVIRIATLKSDPGLKSVVKYGGELLERLKLARGEGSFDKFREMLAKYPHHFNRNARAPE